MISKKDFKYIYNDWLDKSSNNQKYILKNLKNNKLTNSSVINNLTNKYSSNQIISILEKINLLKGGSSIPKNIQNIKKFKNNKSW